MSGYGEAMKEIRSKSETEQRQDVLQCRYCGATTPREQLSTFGARCKPCFGQLLADGFSGSHPAQMARQAGWVREVRRELCGGGVNAFAELAEKLHSHAPQPKAVPGC